MIRNPDQTRQWQIASILFWLILLGWHGLVMGPLWSDGDPDLKLLHESPRDQSWVTVDLRTDPLARLQLISGIGPGLAAKIVTARMERERAGLSALPCRCTFMQIPGLPDRALMDAGPWVLPLPCPGFECLHDDQAGER